jgi:hypothetical protein
MARLAASVSNFTFIIVRTRTPLVWGAVLYR